MSGHSKWSTIKRKKGAEDAKRGKIFTKIAREIAIAARKGGPDPESNAALRLAMDKARAANMPKDNVERAIHRGAGIGDDAVEMEEIVYEGYGPHGVALVISVVTDNRNRTLADLKYILSRNHGNLASAGSVTWQFSQKGYVEVNAEGADYEESFSSPLTRAQTTCSRRKTSSPSTPRAKTGHCRQCARRYRLLRRGTRADLDAPQRG